MNARRRFACRRIEVFYRIDVLSTNKERWCELILAVKFEVLEIQRRQRPAGKRPGQGLDRLGAAQVRDVCCRVVDARVCIREADSRRPRRIVDSGSEYLQFRSE